MCNNQVHREMRLREKRKGKDKTEKKRIKEEERKKGTKEQGYYPLTIELVVYAQKEKKRKTERERKTERGGERENDRHTS